MVFPSTFEPGTTNLILLNPGVKLLIDILSAKMAGQYITT